METVLSTDGTRTTYDRTGQRPALIVIVGAFDERVTGEQSPGDAARGAIVGRYIASCSSSCFGGPVP